MSGASAGNRLKAALAAEQPLQIVGAVHAYAALLAETAGIRAIYLSGAGVANASIGVPDLAITSLEDVLTDIRRITGACDLPRRPSIRPVRRCCPIRRVSCDRDNPVTFARYRFTRPLSGLPRR